MIFVITPERMIKELSTNAKGKLQGQFNWYNNSSDGMVHIHYNHAEAEYLCIMSKESIPMEIRFYMGKNFEVLGLYEEEEEKASLFPQVIDYGGLQ